MSECWMDGSHQPLTVPDQPWILAKVIKMMLEDPDVQAPVKARIRLGRFLILPCGLWRYLMGIIDSKVLPLEARQSGKTVTDKATAIEERPSKSLEWG